MELHPNDNAREAHPSVWIFSGHTVGYLVIGVMLFVCLLTVLSKSGVDWLPAIVISLLPLGAITLFVQCFVNGKPPSYALDLLILWLWNFRVWLYLRGLLERTPQMRIHVPGRPRHPNQFIMDEN